MPSKPTNASGHRGINWASQPLGEVSDCALARQLGVTSAAVRKQRIKRNIPVVFANRWKEVGLGAKPDHAIALALGVSRRTVSRTRRQRGMRGPKVIDWDNQPLGQVSDTALGRLLGVAQTVVSTARRRRGIPRGDLQCRTLEDEPATYPEALIDLYWHEHCIAHEFQVHIEGYVADWVVSGDTVVEYAGFADHRKFGARYRQRLARKLKVYEARGYKVKVIWPYQLGQYDLKKLPLFRAKPRKCSLCGCCFGVDHGPLGGLLRHKAHGLCKNCYNRSRR